MVDQHQQEGDQCDEHRGPSPCEIACQDLEVHPLWNNEKIMQKDMDRCR